MPKINFDEEQVFDAFIGKLLMEKGLFEEDKNQKGKLRHELREELDETIQQAVINALSDEQLTQLDQLLNGDATDSDIEQFFDNAHINYEDVVGAAMREFREKYLGESESDAAAQSTNDMTILNEQPTVADVTPETPNAAPAGAPMQGAVSETPGASNVEGVAEKPEMVTATMTEAVETPVNTEVAENAPMQGTVSEMPGASNVEGVAEQPAMAETVGVMETPNAESVADMTVMTEGEM